MRRSLPLLAAMALLLAPPTHAENLKPELVPLQFLVGHWTDGDGTPLDGGVSSKAASDFTVEQGGVLLSRGHIDFFDADGKATDSTDQIMAIFPADGAVHADYSDGRYLIHYGSAAIVPGRSVLFTSAARVGRPTFKLLYELSAPDRLEVSLSTALPGETAFHSAMKMVLHKAA